MQSKGVTAPPWKQRARTEILEKARYSAGVMLDRVDFTERPEYAVRAIVASFEALVSPAHKAEASHVEYPATWWDGFKIAYRSWLSIPIRFGWMRPGEMTRKRVLVRLCQHHVHAQAGNHVNFVLWGSLAPDFDGLYERARKVVWVHERFPHLTAEAIDELKEYLKEC